ncbi:MAG: hypothetical protein Q4P34_02365 [Tissierellia bacterium]|nr:hypothetical protein [Tissierellia bacterium]
MLKRLDNNEIKRLKNSIREWNKLPLNEDIKSLLVGTSVFSNRDKEIIGLKEGFYKISFDNNEDIIEKLNNPINILIYDHKNKRAFKTSLSE